MQFLKRIGDVIYDEGAEVHGTETGGDYDAGFFPPVRSGPAREVRACAGDGTHRREGADSPVQDGAEPVYSDCWTDAADAAVAEALATAESLRKAAAQAEALAPQLARALRRADKAEAEAKRFKNELADARARIEEMEKQQLRLTEGFLGEIRQRDAELAVLRAKAFTELPEVQAPLGAALQDDDSAMQDEEELARSTMRKPTFAGEALRERRPEPMPDRERRPSTATTLPAQEVGSSSSASIEVFTVTAGGPLGIDFDRQNTCLKIVASIASSSPAAGHLSSGDELASLNGASARNLSWEELDEALQERPLVVSVRRSEDSADHHERRAGQELLGGLAGRGSGFAKNLVDWARATAREIGAAVDTGNLEDGASTPARQGVSACSPHAAGMPEESSRHPEEAAEDPEVRNRPFYELVRSSMAEAVEARDLGTAIAPGDEDAFESWLRNFHSERDDEWFDNNHTRLYNAFHPSWTEVVKARRGMAAS